MRTALVVAASDNNAIGKDNRLLWCLPNDMRFFKNTTWGMPVIMGRKTFDSLGKPLAGRTNIVITRQKDWEAPGAIVVSNMDDALKAAATTDAKEAYVIGGGEIYKQAMPIAQRIYITRVHATLEGDTYFPVIEEKDWELLSKLDFDVDPKHEYAYSFQVWEHRP
jgi:dihydrofolate reductase